MPFLVTEPQRIEGTVLGFSVYPYHFAFAEQNPSAQYNQKLMIFKLKDSQFIEVDKVLHEHRFRYEDVATNYVPIELKKYVAKHPEYVLNTGKMCEYFAGNTTSNTSPLKPTEKIV